jgi:hypothetical protein
MRHPMTTDSAKIKRQKNEKKYYQGRKTKSTFSTFGFARHTSRPTQNQMS